MGTGAADVCRLLVSNCSADLEVRSENGGTALHYAAFNGHAEVVHCLVELGAHIEVLLVPGPALAMWRQAAHGPRAACAASPSLRSWPALVALAVPHKALTRWRWLAPEALWPQCLWRSAADAVRWVARAPVPACCCLAPTYAA